jgi:hypothetical protein
VLLKGRLTDDDRSALKEAVLATRKEDESLRVAWVVDPQGML